MKILRKLIRLHKCLFFMAILFTFFSIFMNLYWNSFLADLIDCLAGASSFQTIGAGMTLPKLLLTAVCIILLHSASEFISSVLASYTCEYFAHEMRVGYTRFYLQSDIRTLSGLNAGQEQSAMQNELSEISAYLKDNFFPLIRQLVSFSFTVIFLTGISPGLTLFSTLPVVPLMLYCAFSSKIIKNLSEQCQESRKQINGLADTLLELFSVIHVYSACKLMDTTINERISEWQRENIRKEKVAARLMSLSGVFSFVPLLFLLGIGGVMVIKGEITIGVFYIFINLSGNVSGFLQNMPNIYAGFRRFSAAVGRIEQKLVLEV